MSQLMNAGLFAAVALTVRAQTVRSGTVSVDWTKLAIEDVGDSLNIALQPPDGMDWIVGFKVKPGASDYFKVADCVPFTPWATKAAGLPYTSPRLSGHASDQITISGASISIQGGAVSQVLVVYVELSRGRSIGITDRAGSATTAYVTSGIVVADGTIRQMNLEGEAELISWALGGVSRSDGGAGLVSADAAPNTSMNGVNTVADPMYLRSHSIRYVEFDSVQPTGAPVYVDARFDISASGEVRNASCAETPRVSADVVAMIVSTINKWSFVPFLVKGQAAPVSARVQVLIIPDGSVTSWLSPNAELKREQ